MMPCHSGREDCSIRIEHPNLGLWDVLGPEGGLLIASARPAKQQLITDFTNRTNLQIQYSKLITVFVRIYPNTLDACLSDHEVTRSPRSHFHHEAAICKGKQTDRRTEKQTGRRTDRTLKQLASEETQWSKRSIARICIYTSIVELKDRSWTSPFFLPRCVEEMNIKIQNIVSHLKQLGHAALDMHYRECLVFECHAAYMTLAVSKLKNKKADKFTPHAGSQDRQSLWQIQSDCYKGFTLTKLLDT